MKLIAKESIATTCPYCGVGCGVKVTSDTDSLEISGDEAHPANRGDLCIKGATLAETQHYPRRMTQASVAGRRVSLDSAVTTIATRLSAIIKEHGPDAVAFYLSGQLLTEDYYVANKLMKGFIGSANVDTNSRLCMASAVAAHKRAFGEDIVACNYEDLEQADLIILVGSNMAWTHPVAFRKALRARDQRKARIVVIDPRRTATCEAADLHLPITPGSDTALFNGLLTHLNNAGASDKQFIREHTEGFDECLGSINTSLTQTSAMTGISESKLITFFNLFVETSRVITVFSQGVNQSVQGTDNGNSIINCHLATGKIGQPGMGPFSITGQPNAMGGREVGGMSNQLAAHMDFTAANITATASFWQAKQMASSPGLKAVDMFDAVATGAIKAIWIMGTNPAVSLPDTNKVKDALTRCPLVIVSEVTHDSDTLAYADVILPAAGWGEKDGTVTNSERMISRQRSFVSPCGDAQPDWQLVCGVARAMGFTEAFHYTSPAEIFREHAALTATNNEGQRLLDLGHLQSISQSDYNQLKPFQWSKQPFASQKFSTPSGRARFVASQQSVAAAKVLRVATATAKANSNLPYMLNSGRLRDQWHTMTRTGNTRKLFRHHYLPTVDIHPADAATLQCADNDLVALHNDNGRYLTLARITTDVKRGELFVPIHWSAQFTSSGTIGQLYSSQTDPISGQPATKQTRVAVTRQPNRLWAFLEVQQPITAFEHEDLSFWFRVPGLNQSQTYGISWQGSSSALRDHIETLIPGGEVVYFKDSQSSDYRAVCHVNETPYWRLHCASSLNDLTMPESIPVGDSWHALTLLGNLDEDKSPTICSCFEVKQSAIEAAINTGIHDAARLGEMLKCGTNCGSCLPEINRLIRHTNETSEKTYAQG